LFVNYSQKFELKPEKWIYIPTHECKVKSYKFIETIKSKWNPPPYFFHFQKGGHISALDAHSSCKYFIKLDIKNFFGNISRARIASRLKLIGINQKKAFEIAKWSTVSEIAGQNKILPFGFVQSQILASLVFDKSSIGKYLRQLNDNMIVSVYVDDIMVSGSDATILTIVYNKLVEEMIKSNFVINIEKSHAPKEYTRIFNIDIQSNSRNVSQERFQQFISTLADDSPQKTVAVMEYLKKINATQANHYFDLIEKSNSVLGV
jgi:hypothetical protein